MEIKKSSINNLIVGFALLLIVAGGIFLFSNRPLNQPDNTNVITEVDGKQFIDLTAKAGYTPSSITAQANKNTILRVNTKNTFDCSTALSIPKLGISKNLPLTGQTEIDLGSQPPGSEIEGTCSMGMYSFKIKFS